LFYTTTPIDFSENGVRDWCCWPRDIIESNLLLVGPGLFRVIIFVAYPLIAYLIWLTMSRFVGTSFTARDRNLYGLLVLFFPVNSARVALITFQWSLALLAFALATYLYVCRKNLAYLVIAVFLYLFSFRMSSLLVLSLVPAVMSHHLQRRENASSFKKPSLRLLLLPILAVLYRVFISDNAVTSTYNSFQRSGIFRALLVLAAGFLVIVFLSLIVQKLGISRTHLFLVATGLLVTWLGAMPYMAVGHLSSLSDWVLAYVPGQGDWGSRHHILIPFGASLAIIGFFKLLEGQALRLLTPLTLSVFMILNFQFSIEYYVDAAKQESMIAELSNQHQLEDERFVYIQEDSSAARYNARGRALREYEFDGMLKAAFGPDAPQFFDERFSDTEPCESPATIPLLRAISPSKSFSRIRAVTSRAVDIRFEVTSLLVCTKDN
jgi:hypothetical protein